MAFSLRERCEVRREAARREERSAVAAAFFEDRNIDRCCGKGSQLTWMRQLRRIDRSGCSVEIAGN